MRSDVARFVQSVNDFPCEVSLGRRLPSWEIKRWGDRRYKNKLLAPEARLRFSPDGEDDFRVRGGSDSVLYKGKNVSHRWTVLGKDVFEYDVILKKAPVSNIVSLTLEGAENFDFYRQPVSRKNPLLSGSYAVYLKQVLTGQGTGKLCHIYRPEIIDASGRRVWGDLFVSGAKLLIVIPENWLASAAYPVLVDPVVGCSAVGSQREWDPWDEGDPFTFFLEEKIPVNDCFLTQDLSGTFTCYFYCVGDSYENINKGIPAIYSDLNGVPYQHLTKNESNVNLHTSTDKWVSGSITTKGTVNAGNTVWFGIYLLPSWMPVFDYGGRLFMEELYKQNYLPDTYPFYDYLNRNEAYNMRLSMYFQYGTMSENYIRSITAGVCLSDSASKRAYFRRGLAAAVKVTECQVKRFLCLVRSIRDSAAVLFSLSRFISFGRFISSAVNVVSGGAKYSLLFFVKIVDSVFSDASLSRRLSVFIRIVTLASVRDYFIRRFLSAGSRLVIKSVITREIVIESKIGTGNKE
jgi:hypothetical protein